MTEEFFALGDKERSEEWAVSPLCDREKDNNLPKNQCGFFEFLCLPCALGRASDAQGSAPACSVSQRTRPAQVLQGRRPNSTKSRARPPSAGIEFRNVEEAQGGDGARLLLGRAR